MESYFWNGDVLDDFLFKGLNTKSWPGLLGVCVALASVALLYEGLHLLKGYFLNRFLEARKTIRRKVSSSNSNADHSSDEPRSLIIPSLSSRRRNQTQDTGGSGEPAPRSLLEETDNYNDIVEANPPTCSQSGFMDLGISSIFHSIYMFLGFTLMNAVMTFNVWILVAICIGIALGYFCFGNYRKFDNLMHPIDTETTSLNESDSTSPIGGGGEGENSSFHQNAGLASSRLPKPDRSIESDDPGESSRLIVGAQVHTPRIVPGSGIST